MSKTLLDIGSSRGVGTPSADAASRMMLRTAGSAPSSLRKRGKASTRPLLHLSPRAGRGRIAPAAFLRCPAAIRVTGRFRKRNRDCFKNARHVAQHIVIPEPQNSVVVIDKSFVANHIARVVRVLSPIHLNNETTFAADKIDYVRTDRFLTNELVTVERARPESTPQSCLRVGGVPSQAPGTPGFDFVSLSHVETPPHPARVAPRPLPARGERLPFRGVA
jgi:hypothetical protein